jgi:hypothetical protein
MHEPFLESWPGGGATCAFLAVKAELLHRVRSYGHGELFEALNKTGGDPIKLLLTFGKDKRRLFTSDDRKAIRSFLRSAFGGKLDLNEHTRAMIELLKDHRDQAQHPEGGKAYRGEQCIIFRQKLWDSGWLSTFLAVGL